MATETTYNGWKNYETWAVNLWLNNDQGTQEYWQEIAEQVIRQQRDDDPDTVKDDATYDLADTLKAEFEENTPAVTGVYADLLNAALSEVFWEEIARHFVDAAWDEMDHNNEADEDDEEQPE